MKDIKIVLIGSGSQFTEFFLQELFKYAEFSACTLALVDRQPERLEQEVKLAKTLNNVLGWNVNVQGHTERKDALQDATFIYCYVAVNSKETWAQEFELCQKHGVNPYEAYTAGAPGLGMAIRHVPVMLDICTDIEAICPEAWLILDNNPLAKILAALVKYTKVKCVGYCNGHEMIVMALEQLLGLTGRDQTIQNADPIQREFMVPAGNVDVLLAGVNHLQWALDIRETATGADLYPKIRRMLKEIDIERVPAGYRFIAEICRRFDYICSPADNHVGDYIWCIDQATEKRTGLEPYPVDQWFGGRDAAAWAEICAGISDDESVRSFIAQRRLGWMSLQIARYMLTGGQTYFPALNVPNSGAISNLDNDIIVEVPGVIGPNSVKAVNVGPLPQAVAPICQLHGAISNLVAQAAATGSRDLALQALLLDPYIHSITCAERLLDDMLAYNKQYETRFN
jgi:alpha-galactosidase